MCIDFFFQRLSGWRIIVDDNLLGARKMKNKHNSKVVREIRFRHGLSVEPGLWNRTRVYYYF